LIIEANYVWSEYEVDDIDERMWAGCKVFSRAVDPFYLVW